MSWYFRSSAKRAKRRVGLISNTPRLRPLVLATYLLNIVLQDIVSEAIEYVRSFSSVSVKPWPRRRFPPAGRNEYFPQRNRSASPSRLAGGNIQRLVPPNVPAPKHRQ